MRAIPMIKISEMTGKLTDIPAINTNTLTNSFCTKMHAKKHPKNICGVCYSQRMLKTYRANCAESWQGNSDLLSHSIIDEEDLPVINSHSFRFNGHGELINLTHYFNIVRICKRNPNCSFALWTKRLDIIKRAFNTINPNGIKPDNLILIYSNPRVDSILEHHPEYFDKVFNNTSTISERDNCSGRKCIECMQCYRKDSGVNVIVEAIKN